MIDTGSWKAVRMFLQSKIFLVFYTIEIVSNLMESFKECLTFQWISFFTFNIPGVALSRHHLELQLLPNCLITQFFVFKESGYLIFELLQDAIVLLKSVEARVTNSVEACVFSCICAPHIFLTLRDWFLFFLNVELKDIYKVWWKDNCFFFFTEAGVNRVYACANYGLLSNSNSLS